MQGARVPSLVGELRSHIPQLSACSSTPEPVCCGACASQPEEPVCRGEESAQLKQVNKAQHGLKLSPVYYRERARL